MSDGDEGLGRRAFLGAGLAMAAGLVGGCASLAALRVPVSDGWIRIRISNHPRLAGQDGALEVRPEGGHQALWVLSDGRGGFVALSPICTHLGCVVDLEGRRLVCPCHGSTYDRDGSVLRGPAERPLSRHPTRVVDGILEIALDVEMAS